MRDQFPRPPAVAQRGERHRRPDRRVRVLAAVLSHARDVAFDVAGIQVRLVERRIEELDQRIVAADQALVHRLHGHARALRRSPGPGEHRPALRDRIDLALGVARRAERRAVVEVGAAIPLAIPAVLLRCSGAAEPPPPGSARRRTRRRARGRPRRTARARRTGRSPARRFRPCRVRPPGSCRRSSRRSPSAAGRARRTGDPAGWRARNARTAWRFPRTGWADRNTSPPPR